MTLPSHTHDFECGIGHLNHITSVTPTCLSNLRDAAGISSMIADSGRILVLPTSPTTSPAGGPATDFGQSPTNPLAWATWSVEVQGHYVIAEGLYINRPLVRPRWENWSAAQPDRPVQLPGSASTTTTAASSHSPNPTAPHNTASTGDWGDGIPTKQPPQSRSMPSQDEYPTNAPKEDQLNVARQNMTPHRI